jgi:hypothetical protein
MAGQFGLTDDELATLIAGLVQYDSNAILAQSELQHFTGKHVDVEIIERVAAQYARQISERQSKLLEDGQSNPLSTARQRLKLCHQIYRRAMDGQSVVRYLKVDGKPKAVTGTNFEAAIAALRLAHRIDLDCRNSAPALKKQESRDRYRDSVEVIEDGTGW